MASRALYARMWRAARLDADLYEQVEAEPRAIWQATLVVLLASAAGALGSWLADKSTERVVLDLIEPLFFWVGSSTFCYMVGATFFRGPETETDWLEVLRTTGFAFAPGLLRALAFVPPPGAGFAATLIADSWILLACIVAVRQALDFGTLRAIGTFGSAYVLMWLFLNGLIFTLPY